MEEKISIIVPNYNNEKYISDCIDSILNQTYKNIEIVIADDCSTDASVKIINRYLEKYPGIIKAVYADKNQGVAKNRDMAIKAASGNYISTLDSDDIYFSRDKLAKELALIEFYKDSKGLDVCAFSNTALLSRELNFIRERGNKRNISEGKIFDYIITRSCEIPLDFLMKKDLYYNAGGYDFSFRIYEDWDLKIRLAKKYEFYYTGITGTGYRQHNQGLSSANRDKIIQGLKAVFRKNFPLVEERQKKAIEKKFNQFIKKAELNCKIKKIKESPDFRREGDETGFRKIYHYVLLFYLKVKRRLA